MVRVEVSSPPDHLNHNASKTVPIIEVMAVCTLAVQHGDTDLRAPIVQEQTPPGVEEHFFSPNPMNH